VNGSIPPLADDDHRRLPLRHLVRSVWERYGGEIIINETSHIGDKRGPWLREVAREAEALLLEGVPLRGVCLYPILGMPEWHDPYIWTPMGLWDPARSQEPCGTRLICKPMLEALRDVRHINELHRRMLAVCDTRPFGLQRKKSRASSAKRIAAG
jgi:hypothetical protein